MLNEHIKSTIDIMMPVYIKLFNKELNTGEVPEDWLVGLIVPIFKQKGSKTDCNNYRWITLLSCLGKLFTSTLNEILYIFGENNHILKEIQGSPHFFVLKHIDLFIKKSVNYTVVLWMILYLKHLTYCI